MKKKNVILFLMCAVFASGMATAQTITGKITDTNHAPIEGATVVLQDKDSVFIDAAITDADGKFSVNSKETHYRLILQHLLYHTLQCERTGADAGTIALTPKDYALGEVVVRGERPPVKVESGRLTYDMPRLIEAKLVTNAYECVKELPGVIEQNGSLTLAGASSLSLILNGRPSSMTYEQVVELLKSTPASRVEKAEIMYSAPPQYHVRGAAVNIVLRGYKQGEGGLQGEVDGSYMQESAASGKGGVTLAYTSPKIDADFMYHVNNKHDEKDRLALNTLHTVQGKIYNVEQTMNSLYNETVHRLRVGTSYKPDEKNRVGLTYTANFSPAERQDVHTSGNMSDSYNHLDGTNSLHNLAFDCTTGFGMKAGADYTYFSSQTTQSFSDTDKEGNQNIFSSPDKQRIDRWTVYADQTHTLPREWALHYGASFAHVRSHSRQFYENASQDMGMSDTDSRIREYTYNLYAGFEKSFGAQWSVSASAAVEYYQMESYRKWAVYPTVNLGYVASPAHVFQLSFSSDKTYPDYWTLSGATSFMNLYAEAQGNPWLKPYTDYSANLTYILRSKYIFSLSYDYIPDYFMQMIYLDSNRLKAVYNYQNWDYNQRFSLVAVIPFKASDWFDGSLTLVGLHTHNKASRYYDAPFDKKKWSGIGRWTSTFTLSHRPNIQFEASAFGQTGAIQGSYEIKPVGNVDAALRWNSNDGKAMVQLQGTDLFDTLNPKVEVRNGTQHIDMATGEFNRSLTLSFSYKFGGYKPKDMKKVDTSRFGH